MTDNLATKQDILLLKQDIQCLDFKIDKLESKMIIKLGAMLIVAVGLIVTLQKII